ncbi:hypothetical protein [Streptomyces sp. NPDC052496]|uniref:CTP synthase C-terminal region-related (seleno)protein n=1 Tax=Streptomyces sp. NPDC052496 TaxID=3154951 RepID=UPI003413E7C2
MAITARIALVGDRSEAVRSHVRIPGLLDALRVRDGLDLDAYWVGSEDVEQGAAAGAGTGIGGGVGGGVEVGGFDAVWVVPGSPYRSEAGVLAAIRAAREGGVPFLGTCGGFQHALLEFARNVCGLDRAGHAENEPETPAEEAVVVPLACSLVGHEGMVEIAAGSRAAQLIGSDRTRARYHCSYGPNPQHLGVLREHGMSFSGIDESGNVRIAELPGHSFFLATLFQPELDGEGAHHRVHPLIAGLARAAVERAAGRCSR